MIGTPNGFVKYAQELLKPNTTLISDNYKSLLFNENRTNDGKATGMCLSWFKGSLKGNTYFTHAGGGGGYYCEIRIYPDSGIGSVIMFNRTGMSDERFLNKLDNYFVDEKNSSR
ncbi:serine hydrolase domain-containing protein [Pleomorphovibrio marinus]|uniref:serine hydrolase n=1 Tax=Pleomorphovibrio marinus TaxID=2164132 RepID=UPI0013005D62|nr:serine hydrolase [Pleomorphovibrio marinus]